jgi:cell division protein ZapA (FtsZ GTPase activity inhibitor)
MSELIPVNIVIGDRTYRIKTAVSDEEVIRKTVKLINDKIVEFKTQFSGKDMQDYCHGNNMVCYTQCWQPK